MTQTYGDLAAQLIQVAAERDKLRHDVQAAYNLAETYRCNWERAEAECAELRTWKAAVPVAAMWAVYHLTASRFEYECVASWLPLAKAGAV